MKIEFQVQCRIGKPIAEVFDAVINPGKLSSYFTESSSGPLREGEEAIWRFAEFPVDVPVTVLKIIPNKLIRLEWEAQEGGYNTQVDIHFREIDATTTLLLIQESGWREGESNLQSSYLNCSGWMHMLCCMKAYLEHGINLRTGSFHKDDFQMG